MQVLVRMREQNLAQEGVGAKGLAGGMTLVQLVEIVEKRKRCEVVNAAWLEARGLGMPKVVEADL
jgi:hypothetical protein